MLCLQPQLLRRLRWRSTTEARSSHPKKMDWLEALFLLAEALPIPSSRIAARSQANPSRWKGFAAIAQKEFDPSGYRTKPAWSPSAAGPQSPKPSKRQTRQSLWSGDDSEVQESEPRGFRGWAETSPDASPGAQRAFPTRAWTNQVNQDHGTKSAKF